jgi:predicted PhzF superfamily epimerase YddE/YHI9
MRIPLYQIDAFARRPFEGNPAAVCPLDQWLGDDVLQAIAAENNLSETAFFLRKGETNGVRRLRWFTPTVEVDLCGHATLAAGYLVLDVLRDESERVTFATRSGELCVSRGTHGFALNLPSRPPVECEPPDALLDALDRAPVEILAATNCLCVYEDEDDVRDLAPDFARLAHCDPYGVIVTAPGRKVDFVSRYFAPSRGVNEDPVTGSAHCTLAPYWARRLGKTRLRARQLSRRGGDLVCELRGDRVVLEGDCVLVIEGTLYVP